MMTIEEINSKRKKQSLLVAIHFGEPTPKERNGKRQNTVVCKCKCGGSITMTVYYFTKGRYYSCGCLTRWGNKHPISINTPIGKRNSVLYSRWVDVIRRCYNPKHISYPNYGAKGVTVCDEWRYSFQNFAEWCMNNGFQEDLELDKDILGNGTLYSPESCKFVTPMVNSSAKAKKYLLEGQLYTLTQLSEKTSIKRNTLYTRLRSGQSILEAIRPKP